MTKILLCGANGKMGQAVTRVVSQNPNAEIIAGYDIAKNPSAPYPVVTDFSALTEKPDVIIDFSHPALTDGILDFAVSNGIPVVICTTGLSADQVSRIEYESKNIPLFFSANMSLGVNLIMELVAKAAKVLQDNFDIEIIEKHHNQKLDAPSGTALAIADNISRAIDYAPEYTYDRHSVRKKRDKKEIGIHAVRGGTIVGEHNVIFAGNDEVIEIKHTATSKEVFAVGAVSAAEFLKAQPAGLYSMKHLIK